MSTDIETPDGIASWDVIKELYELDSKSRNFKICPKITKRHVEPNAFEKMRVCYATQVLSYTVAAGIRTCLSNGKFSQKTQKKAEATACFAARINSMFDCLNSRNLNERNIYKRPLTLNSRVIEYLEDSKNYMKTIKLVRKNKNYCINGCIHSISAIMMLCKDILNDPKMDVHFLLTARLNQDPIENIFAQIRAKGGNNKNPSVHEFKYIIARLMSIKLLNINSPNQNCENDDDIVFDWIENDLSVIELNDDNGSIILNPLPLEKTKDEEECVKNIEEELGILPTCPSTSYSFVVEENAQRYYVGYAISKIIFKKFDCSACASVMAREGFELLLSTEQHIYNKDFKVSNSETKNSLCLNYPSHYFFSICRLQFKIYQDMYNKFIHASRIKEKIIKACVEQTNLIYPEWFVESCPCFSHRKTILDFLILVLLRKNCSWIVKNEIRTYFARNSRLKNLLQ